MGSFERLLAEVSSNASVDSVDVSVLSEIVCYLTLHDLRPEDINEELSNQISIEANITYLVSKYKQKLEEKEFEYETTEANILLDAPKRNEEGYKAGPKEVKAYLDSNPELAVKRWDLISYKNLYNTLYSINKIVFLRYDKIKELSTNYRHELKSDTQGA